VTNRAFVNAQSGDHIWVFGKGAMGPARWMVPVKAWEIDGAGTARPVTSVELKDPYSTLTNASGYLYAVPAGDYYLYDERLYDTVGEAFNQWIKEQTS
jgi:hypothetical protein